ncbi:MULTISPECIES: hypothetical protein [unclassified Streptomyces]|uniref:hypothetical protein n=1 Tax=unclassified Streptomyces TaxID=2593676 RepID=UPI0011B94313|nr:MULTISPECIES: hypothetical protein [unclassified Streptomyces]MYT70368.1 hypothetical protein [Streptomyces sp. SID8367]
MAAEWIAPVVTGVSGALGVVFTWLAGAQGRAHAERMVDRSQTAERRSYLRIQRRDAYFSALRVAVLDVRRLRYEQTGKTDKLDEVEQYWTKTKRIEMSMEALISVHAFGSNEARQFLEEWRAATEADDLAFMQQLVEQFRELIRGEFQEG